MPDKIKDSKTRKVVLLGEFYLEVTVGEDCDGGTEIQGVDNIEALLNYEGSKETPVHLSIDEISAMIEWPKGEIGAHKREALEALIDRQDKEEEEQAEQDRAETVVEARR